MPDMEDFEDEDEDEDGGGREMIKHLLVAADRYAMGRLKRVCEAILRRSLEKHWLWLTSITAAI
jgi:hypothetical protein